MVKLFQKKTNVQCNNCNQLTPYIVKKKKLFGEFERIYAECKLCKYQKTVYFTSKKLRTLLKKQENETFQPRKELLREKIESEAQMLSERFEGGKS
ncbi:hypothetical protein JZO72_08195 [Vagococcus fluvialis]|uniref:hypothetical protein n=1 Tax=Vagococcus TaxID=2737 RepID=UPI001A8D5C37|nr:MULTISPECIES: hypothetical protein [Vagococcus]MBO0479609.1 hypothetical protein [Vagococcus fluvialis]MBO0485363.1 hypothetical protein [Vagococcus fluvialis]MDT2829742.1 hypothetical protein [Vagococcus carniphilus]MDT2839201.1 hypothetical protein [Vagococcus carniphilus]MDT2853259.1 hypothetical protein [Vagococcus carniphilus]